MLTFIPVDAESLSELRAGELRDVAAHATTPALFDALALEPGTDEDAEFAALTYASVAALTRSPRRLVAVADVPQAALQSADFTDDFGQVRLERVTWTQVTCLFAGDPVDVAAETAAGVAAAGLSVEEAWDVAAVAELVETTDLLWYAPQEADEVLAQSPRD